MAEWSELPPELVVAIASELKFYEDSLFLQDVCASWKSAVERNDQLPCRYPCLMLPDEKDEEEEPTTTTLMDDIDENNNNNMRRRRRKFHLLSSNSTRELFIPEAFINKRCFPACGGWLFAVSEEDDVGVRLYHPLSGVQIDNLPKLDTLPDYSNHYSENQQHLISKVALSSADPNSPDFLVIVIWGGWARLGFCKLGSDSWSDIGDIREGGVEDVIYYNGRVYAVTLNGKIVVCDIIPGPGSYPITFTWELISTLPRSMTYTQYFRRVYIVKKKEEASSDMNKDKFYIIFRDIEENGDDDDSDDSDYTYDTDEEEDDPVLREIDTSDDDDDDDDDDDIVMRKNMTHGTVGFDIFEIDLRDGGKWSRIKSFGNESVFIGYNTSFSIEATMAPSWVIRPNCIYYTDYYEGCLDTVGGAGQDMGICDLSKRTFETLIDDAPCSRVMPPTWVMF